jgi:CheY-like chemotaxis protein
MGGNISVKSEYGQGSVFTVAIPQGVKDFSPFTEDIDSAANYADAAVSFSAPTARFLIVDDILTNLKVAEGLLALYQATVETCQSGIEAIELVKKNNYDIVFMDHLMPGMDGIEATTVIRYWEKEQLPVGREQVPIIALTANAVSGMREVYLEEGFNDYLSKPIDVSELDKILTRWIPKGKSIQKTRNGKETEKKLILLEENMGTEKKLIILVDDNPTNLRIGKNVLSEKYTVSTSPSAAKLFGLLENNHPALILLDIDMPEMDGFAAIEILKSKPETKGIPVIFLTGMINPNDEEKGRTLGAVDYITKPFDPPMLIACIEKHICKPPEDKIP